MLWYHNPRRRRRRRQQAFSMSKTVEIAKISLGPSINPNYTIITRQSTHRGLLHLEQTPHTKVQSPQDPRVPIQFSPIAQNTPSITRRTPLPLAWHPLNSAASSSSRAARDSPQVSPGKSRWRAKQGRARVNICGCAREAGGRVMRPLPRLARPGGAPHRLR